MVQTRKNNFNKSKRKNILGKVPQRVKDRDLSNKHSSQKQLLLFAVKFFSIFVVLNVLIELADLSFLTGWLASVVGWILGVATASNILLINSSQFVVTNSCTGLVSASILASIVFALRLPSLKKKIGVFVLGLVVLMLINVPRVALVVLAAKRGFDVELVHELTWGLMSAIVLLIWYYGTKKITRVKEFSELL